MVEEKSLVFRMVEIKVSFSDLLNGVFFDWSLTVYWNNKDLLRSVNISKASEKWCL